MLMTHYVSTVPFNEETMENNVIDSNQLAKLMIDQCTTKTIMSSEISKTELCKKRDQKILKKQENLKGGHSTNAKNQILIILES